MSAQEKTRLSPGVHFDVEDAVYHADPCDRPSLSSTLARTLLDQSPLHAWYAHPRLNPDWEPTHKAHFDIGRAAHSAVLGKGGKYCAIPDQLLSADGGVRTKAAKEWVEEARENHFTPLKPPEYAQLDTMQTKVHDKLDQCRIWLDTDRSEVCAIAEIDDCLCRVLMDNAPEDPSLPIYDFKTTTDASVEKCIKAVVNYGYDTQAAHYTDVWHAVTGEKRNFRFIFQEKDAPFEVTIVELDEAAMMLARRKTKRAREIWRQCISTNHWPGYPTGIQKISTPSWAQEKWFERESAEADFKKTYGRDILDNARRWQAPLIMEGTQQ